MNNPEFQEKAKREYNRNLWRYLCDEELDKYIGQRVGAEQVRVTKSGLLAAGSSIGAGDLSRAFKSGNIDIATDRDGVKTISYLKKFGGYNVDGMG